MSFGYVSSQLLFNSPPNRQIPEAVLQGWAGVGANKTAQLTHESIRRVVGNISFKSGFTPTLYLQGSYKNDTNIRSDSDVDIVVEFPFLKNMLMLYASYESDSWISCRDAVLNALRSEYGYYNATSEKKCLKVAERSWSLSADLVIAFPYYQKNLFSIGESYTQGIRFYVPNEQRWVVNFPKQHYANGTAKNSLYRTNGWYKHLVRIFKNACKAAQISVPSYFLECLIYNAPDALFGTSYQQSFDKILDYLARTSFEYFMCQNGEMRLFGSTPEQWSVNEARLLINGLIRLRASY